MIKYLKKTLIILTVMAFTIPITAEASKIIDGWMQGLDCVRHGHRCPIDRLDPHLMFEPDFVLLLDNGDYFLLPNIARIVKAKYVHKPIRVIGRTDNKYKTIYVDKLQVKDGNSYVTVWSKKMMQREWEKRQEEYYGAGGGA
jgi:hypothetical protein